MTTRLMAFDVRQQRPFRAERPGKRDARKSGTRLRRPRLKWSIRISCSVMRRSVTCELAVATGGLVGGAVSSIKR